MTSTEYINNLVAKGDKIYRLREYYHNNFKNLVNEEAPIDEINKAFNQYSYYNKKATEYMTILEHVNAVYELMEDEYGRNKA